MADRKLWEVMRDAYAASSGYYIDAFEQSALPGPRRQEFKAMLRALADEVVPEEQAPGWEPAYKLYERQQRQRTRALLLQAAAEAKGES